MLTSDVFYIKTRLAAARVEVDTYLHKANECERREEAAKQRMVNVTKDWDEARQEVDRLTVLQKDLLVDVSKLNDRNSQLVEEMNLLETQKRRLDKLLLEMSTLAEEKETLILKLEKSNQERDAALGELDTAQANIKALAETLSAARKDISILNNVKQNIEKKLEDEKKKFVDLNTQLLVNVQKGKEASALIDKLKEEIASKNKGIEGVTNEKRNVERLLFKATVETVSEKNLILKYEVSLTLSIF